jgi:hypothetical protein
MAVGTGAMTSGFSADNFVALPSAPIPEPATSAVGLGAMVLLAAGLKRRLRQQ